MGGRDGEEVKRIDLCEEERMRDKKLGTCRGTSGQLYKKGTVHGKKMKENKKEREYRTKIEVKKKAEIHKRRLTDKRKKG